VSERSERALRKNSSELTLFHSILLTRFHSFCSCFIKNAPRFARRSADDAYLKMNAIFANHISFTQRIKPEVVDYLSEHWEEWVADENNEWFTTGFRRGIPDSYIPQRVLVLYGETENKKRRRRGSSNSLARVFQLDSNSDSSMDSNGE